MIRSMLLPQLFGNVTKVGINVFVFIILTVTACADSRGKKSYIDGLEKERYDLTLTQGYQVGNLMAIKDQNGATRKLALKDLNSDGSAESIDINADGVADSVLLKGKETRISPWAFIVPADINNDSVADYYLLIDVGKTGVSIRFLVSPDPAARELVFLISITGQITGLDNTGDGVADDARLNGLVFVAATSDTDFVAPSGVTTLAAGIVTSSSVQLNWTAVGDDATVGTASTYEMRYLTGGACPLTAGNFATGTLVTGIAAPSPSGTTTETTTVMGLASSTSYCFALLVADEAGNKSLLSNVVTQATIADVIAPAAVTTLSAGAVTSSSITLSWQAVGDDANTGVAASYAVRYLSGASCPITAGNFASGTLVTGLPTPSIAGTLDSVVVTGLLSSTTYCFAMTVSDEVPNVSALSNVVTQATLSPAVWTNQAYVKAPNPEANDWFGRSVAFSGDTMAVGAPGEDSNQTFINNGSAITDNDLAVDSGAVYIYRRSGATWVYEAYIKAPNADAGEIFGTAVALDGDTLVVGAQLEDSSQTSITNGSSASNDNGAPFSGSVYVFRRTGSTWAQEAYLKAPNAEAVDFFGISVAISGDTIVVGAYQEDSNQNTITNGSGASSDNSATDAGAAYVFRRTGSTWSNEAYLKAPNADSNDFFGYSVAISGDTIVVGAYGESSGQNSISNGTTASADNSAASAGAAYVFKRTGSVWAQEAYLKAANAEANDFFGYSVGISADTIVVGALQERSSTTAIINGVTASADNSATGAGAAYVFQRSGVTWAAQAYLKAPNAQANDAFGVAVAISADTIVVGSHQEDSNQMTITNGATASADNSSADAGAAYIFTRTGVTWTADAYLKAPNTGTGDSFGKAVAVDANTVVIGAFNEDSNQSTITNGATASSDNSASNAGSAYVFFR